MRRLTIAAFSAVLFASNAHALLTDHLQCFAIKDTQAKVNYTATLTPADVTFPVAAGCKIRVPAKLLCVDVEKSGVTPAPPGAGPGAQAQKYLCYKTKCPKTPQSVPVDDQFGSRSVTVKATSLVCAPFPAPTTTTTTTTSSTTTTMSGCTTNGDCPSPPNATGQCVATQCTFSCLPGFSDCNASPGDGCEVNTNSSPSNCGSCGFMCSANNVPTPSCGSGLCNGSCAAGFADCNGNLAGDGCEANLQSSTTSCGGCGFVCSSNNIPMPTCTSGTCNGTCSPGFADCNGNKRIDGCETNVSGDPNNCGGCGVACSTNHISPSCGSGQCNGTCAMGFADCDNNKQANGCETNTTNDHFNCGGCGVLCPPSNPTCMNSVCM